MYSVSATLITAILLALFYTHIQAFLKSTKAMKGISRGVCFTVVTLHNQQVLQTNEQYRDTLESEHFSHKVSME